MGKVIKELPPLHGQVEFVCVTLLAAAIGLCVSSCSVTEFTGTDFEDGANENIAVQDTPEEQDPDNDTIPYDPNAGSWVVHELVPVEADFQKRDQVLASYNHYLHGDPVPDVPIVKWVRVYEQPKYLVKCLRSKGLDVKLEENGYSFETADPAEDIRYDKASYWCMAAYPYIEVTTRPLKPEQGRILYKYYVETLIPCLQKAGYNGPFELPSEETFLNQVNSTPRYSPYNFAVPEEEYSTAEQKCPERPAYEEIWGRY